MDTRSPLRTPPVLQYIGKAAYFPVQFPVGDLFVHGGVVAFPDDGDVIAAGLKVPVQAVVRDVQLRAGEPLDVHPVIIPVLDLVPFLIPGDELFGLFGPERFGFVDRVRVHLFVLFRADMCGGRKRRRRRVNLYF